MFRSCFYYIFRQIRLYILITGLTDRLIDIFFDTLKQIIVFEFFIFFHNGMHNARPSQSNKMNLYAYFAIFTAQKSAVKMHLWSSNAKSAYAFE